MKTFIVVFLSSAALWAQEPMGAGVRGTAAGFATPTFEFVSAVNIGPTIAGAPYSADVVNESVQKLADGNRIVQSSSTKQYRDSAGRERHEMGPMTIISDPVAKVRYTLHPQTKTAEKMPSGGGGNGAFFFREFEAGQRVTMNLEHRGEMAMPAMPMTAIASPALPMTTMAASTMPVTVMAPLEAPGPVTPLGLRSIEGVQASGTRSVRTIPAGAVGNERPIEVVDESWSSPDLGITVLSTHSDPRTGDTTYKLTNIQRSEPPRSLFEVPSDYRLIESAFSLKKQE